MAAILMAALTAVVLVVEVATFAWWPLALAQVAVLAWLSVSGVVLCRRALGPGHSGTAVLVGPILGIALGTLGLLLLWAVGLQNGLALLLAPFAVWALALRPPGALRDLVPPLRLGRADGVALCALALVAAAITWLPYAHVGTHLARGDAYRAYFTADFVWAMSVSAELAKGAVPPVNPFLSGATLHYYWLSHLLSGAEYRNAMGWGVRVEDIILVNGLGFGLCFIACFYWLIRTSGAAAAFAAIGGAAGFLANSYEGLDRLLVLHARHLPLGVLREINIDAVTRWYYQGMPVDGLQRLLLYQPHHLAGYALSLLAVWLVARAPRVTSAGVAVTAGTFLGAAFLFSTFTAIIAGAATAVIYAARLANARAWTSIIQCAVIGAAPVTVAVAVSFFLGYVDRDNGGLFVIGLNPVALHRWPLMLTLSFGPLLVLGVAGMLLAVLHRRADAWPAAVLATVSFVFYLFVDVRDMGGVWVGWRTGHLILIAFAALGALALDLWWRAGRPWRLVSALVVVPLLLLGLPTTIIDVFNAQDVENRAVTATFPWTLVITPAERDALDWIRHSTPPEAIVQVEPRARDAGTWAYIPAFAERRMAAGIPISMIPLLPYQRASDDVTFGIFEAMSAVDAREMARFLGIDYVVVGAPERRRHPAAVAMFAAHPEVMRPAFQNEEIVVYDVRGR